MKQFSIIVDGGNIFDLLYLITALISNKTRRNTTIIMFVRLSYNLL